MLDKQDLQKHKTVYYARIVPQTYIYEVCELLIRTVEETYFVGIDKRDKHAYLFLYSDINNTVFENRKEALKKVKDAEKTKIKTNYEIYYEED